MSISVHIQDEALRRRARVRAAELGVSVGVWVEGLIRRELDGTPAPELTVSRKPSVAPSLPPRMAVPPAKRDPEPAARVVEDDDILLEPDEPVVGRGPIVPERLDRAPTPRPVAALPDKAAVARLKQLMADRRIRTGSEFAGPLTKERSMK